MEVVLFLASEDTFDDEFGEFDEADFSVADPEAHPDEVVLTEPPVAPSRHFNGVRTGNAPNTGNSNASRAPINRPQPAPGPTRPSIPAQSAAPNNNPPQPQTPNSGFTRSTSGAAQAMRPPPDSRSMSAQPQLNPPTVAGRVLNQPSRNGPPSAPASPARMPASSDEEYTAMPPQGAGFFSARAAAKLAGGDQQINDLPPIPKDTPAFNLHAESPSIRKTPGVDHKTSKPLSRNLKEVPSSQAAAGAAPVTRGPASILNPQMDSLRRIGQPGAGGSSPNRGAFKPLTAMKRPVDNGSRVPLVDLPANGPMTGDVGGGDIKRQRMNG